MDEAPPPVPAQRSPSFPKEVRAWKRQMRETFKALTRRPTPDELLKFVDAKFRNAMYDLEEDMLAAADRGGKLKNPPRSFAFKDKEDDDEEEEEEDADSVCEDENGDDVYDSDFAETEAEQARRMSREEASRWWNIQEHMTPAEPKRRPVQNLFFVASMDTTTSTKAEQRYSQDPIIRALKTQRLKTQEMIRWINSHDARSPALHVFEDLLQLIDPKLHREEQRLYQLSQLELQRRERQPRGDNSLNKNDNVQVSKVARRRGELVYTPIATRDEVYFKKYYEGKLGKKWWELLVSSHDAKLMRHLRLRRVKFFVDEGDDGDERMRIPCNSKHVRVDNADVVESDDEEASEFSPDEDDSGSSDSSCSSESDNGSDDAVDGPARASRRNRTIAP